MTLYLKRTKAHLLSLAVKKGFLNGEICKAKIEVRRFAKYRCMQKGRGRGITLVEESERYLKQLSKFVLLRSTVHDA